MLSNNSLLRLVSEAEVDTRQFSSTLEKIKTYKSRASELQEREFLVGFEMSRELDVPIDKAVKKIASHCSELLNTKKDHVEWLETLQQEILTKAELIRFADEYRPAALNVFFSKYSDLANSFYYSCIKGFFSEAKSSATNAPPIGLIGEPLDANGNPIGGISRRLSAFGLFSQPVNSNSSPASPSAQSVPFEFGRLMLKLFTAEVKFYKALLEAANVRRRQYLLKSFAKSFTYGKVNCTKATFFLKLLGTLKSFYPGSWPDSGFEVDG